MHELGHNLGLHHGGGIDTPCVTDANCGGVAACTQTPTGKYCLLAEEFNWKPNYLSVMNYRYQFTGIATASSFGSSAALTCHNNLDCPSGSLCNLNVCARLDFSNEVLPVGGNTPGSLDQSNIAGTPFGDPGLGLNDLAGLGSSTTDLFTFTDSLGDIPPTIASAHGPVDWAGNGSFTELHVAADTTCGVDHICGNLTFLPRLYGHADWSVAGQNQFTYKFQCTP